ncbi:pilus assembly protein PilP [Pseudomonas sp. SWRI100]|nr:pilus assembly protein PilP [Pseudomonas sp. SWRI67]MBV4529178.1 pilus assembly protein PilP [Pseudomonas kermanshahensis]
MNAAWWVSWQGMAERSARFRWGASVGLGVLVLALGCGLRLPELRHAQGQVNAQYEQLSEEHSAKAAQVRELARMRAALAATQQALHVARWRLAAGEGMSDLLDSLAASGHEFGLLFERLDVHEAVEQAHYRTIPLDVQVVGRYAALRLWLDEWLGQLRLLRVSDLSMNEVDGRPGLLRVRLRVHAHHADATTPAVASLADLPARAAPVPPLVDPFSAAPANVAPGELGRVPLAQLEMVGSLAQGGAHEALLLSAGQLYRVRLGDRLGRDEGVVVHIDEQRVDVRERWFVAREWHERTAVLTLRKPLDQEVMDKDEKAMDSGGVRLVDPAGDGSPHSG